MSCSQGEYAGGKPSNKPSGKALERRTLGNSGKVLEVPRRFASVQYTMAVTSNIHAARLAFQRISEPGAESDA